MVNTIYIISSRQIDKKKWNHCISQSSNDLIYAQYQMLDALCDNWSGLIVGDYETVLPMPWRQKFGIRYLYAPAFIQQLGFYGNLIGLDMQVIWKTIFRFAKYGELYLNYTNKALLDDVAFIEKTNFILDLSQAYPTILSGYKHDLIKNLQKSGKQTLYYSNDLLIEPCIHLFQTQYQERFPHLNKLVFIQFLSICKAFSPSNNCITRTVFTEETNELLASAVILKNSRRLFLIMNVTTQKGRALAANHFLLDQIIQEFSEENLIFDFEGSERKGIREFYQSFHPENQPYFQVSFNKLPSWINWIRSRFFNLSK